MYSAEHAATEIIRRKQIRASLDRWAEHNGFKPARHHRLLNTKLEAVLRGEIPRLAVFMPPGSAKSTYSSILFPPYVMANDPKAMFLAASHTSELAERWGRRVRNLIAENSTILGVSLKDDNQAAGRWAISGGGEYLAAGAGVGIAGFRAKYGLIDDPIRSRQDADSLAVRDKLWEWYLYDFRPRLIPDARQILIQTRWHDDDLAGRALNHEPWEVLELPALAKMNDALGREVDQPLWTDDDYGYGAQLLALRETTPPRVWSALYQQSPTPDEGDYFKEEWLKPRDILPSPQVLRCYGGSDYAVTADGGDYTVHVVVGIDHLNNMYLLDVWRGQKSSDVWIEAFCDLVAKYRPLEWAEEQGQIKSGVGPFLEKRMRQRRVYVTRRPFPTRGDKSVRARSIQGRMALDGLYYPKHAPWVPEWLAELLNFPASKHDDQVDAMGLVGQLLDIMVTGRVGKPQDMKLPDDGYRRRERNTIDHMTL
ncbi:putative phage terminase large subunit-like protein [Bradyrhizobium sp. AZCC 2176]